MKSSIYTFDNYKTYLINRLDVKNGMGKGGRTRLCEAMGCQTAYLSQVLNGQAHLSPEQGDALNRFFDHSDDESEYFFLLLQYGRAGTESYRLFTKKLLDKFRNQKTRLKSRLEPAKELTLNHQIKYYSAWYYAAIHMATTLSGNQSVEKIAKRLSLEPSLVLRVLEFLISAGLVRRKKEGFEATTQRAHLGDDSDLVAKCHTGWRVRSLPAIEKNNFENLHYSSVVTIAKPDASKLREHLVDCIQSCKGIIKESGSDEIYCLSMDWFDL